MILGGGILSTVIALLIFLAVGYINTTNSGVIIEAERFMEYTSYFGIKQGKWKARDKFPDISVLKANVSSSMLSRGNARISAKETLYKVYMLSKTHRTRVLLNSFSSKAEALALAKKLKEDFGFELRVFLPKQGM